MASNSITDGQKLNHEFFQHGKFARIHMIADGSCFFHSLACALNYGGFQRASRVVQTRLGRELRSLIMTEARYKNFLARIDPELREAKDEDGEGLIPTLEEAQHYRYAANDPLWRLSAEALGVTILVVESPTHFYVTPDTDLFKGVVILGHINKSHFEPIVSIDGATDGLPAPRKSLLRATALLNEELTSESDGRVSVFDINSKVVQRFLSWRCADDSDCSSDEDEPSSDLEVSRVPNEKCTGIQPI